MKRLGILILGSLLVCAASAQIQSEKDLEIGESPFYSLTLVEPLDFAAGEVHTHKLPNTDQCELKVAQGVQASYWPEVISSFKMTFMDYVEDTSFSAATIGTYKFVVNNTQGYPTILVDCRTVRSKRKITNRDLEALLAPYFLIQ